jgi:hypothetical protein
MLVICFRYFVPVIRDARKWGGTWGARRFSHDGMSLDHLQQGR